MRWFADPEGHTEGESLLRILEPVAEQLAQRPQTIAHRLRMHVEGRRDALDLPGRAMGWDPVLAGAAVVGGLEVALLTGAVVYGKGAARFVATCISGALSIIVLHFTAMSAMTVTPECRVSAHSDSLKCST